MKYLVITVLKERTCILFNNVRLITQLIITMAKPGNDVREHRDMAILRLMM